MGRFFTVDISPNVNNGAATGTAFADKDLIFDWHEFKIPKGTASLVSVFIKIAGHDGAAINAPGNIDLFFAKTIDEQAPTSLGTTHANVSDSIALFSRNNIIGRHTIAQGGAIDNLGLTAYTTYSSSSASSSFDGSPLILSGEPESVTDGFQKLYIAAFTTGSNLDFGTAVASNEDGSANVAADTTGSNVVLKTSGTNPLKCFAVGDTLVGSTGGPTMEVVSIDSATQITVKNITEQIDNAEVLVPLNPLKFTLGFQY
jgi:hypothetical protein